MFDDNTVWKDAQSYFKDMSNFNSRNFINHIIQMSRNDWCVYMIEFNNVLHKDDFMTDMRIFGATLKSGQRSEDVIKENSHHLKEYVEELKKESEIFQEYAIQSLMPIRYYFTEEIKGIVEYFNAEVDKQDLSEEKKLRKKFLVYDFIKSKL